MIGFTKGLPVANSDEEYSFFAEKAYPIDDDRRKYFQHLTENKNPSLGYHLAAMLAEIGWIKSIWTTNFDGLSLKAAHQYNLIPVEVTLESQERIYRADVDRELLCVALHGDYIFKKSCISSFVISEKYSCLYSGKISQ